MRIVIFGNGVAGVSAAEAIRAEDKASDITIVTGERHAFYSRPRLVELLANKATVGQITIHDEAWYEKNGIKLVRSTRIAGIDTDSRRLWDDGGNAFLYDRLIIAAGACCFVPSFINQDLENVLTLRTIEDAETIKRTAMTRKKAAVIGGGLLGLEIAGSLRALGVEVRVIEIAERLLPRQLDCDGSAMLRNIFEAKGFSFRTGARTESIERKNGSLQINLAGAAPETVDFAVISAGIKPNIDLFNGTAIGRGRGITVDHRLRTNIPGIYCCGDAAEYCGTIYGLWQAGREQGIVCGGHIAGKEVEYRGSVPSTRLKVAGVEVASIGDIEGRRCDGEIAGSDPAAMTYRKLFVRDGKLVGAILIGNAKDAARLQQMIKRGEAPTR